MRTKLLIDCHVFDEGFQGTTTYIRGLYKAMITNQDFDYYFAAYDTDHLKKIFGERSNITYLKYRSKNKFYRLSIDLPYLIKKHNIHFSHYQYITPFIKNSKQIVTIHDILYVDFPQYFPWIYRFIKGHLFKRSAKIADILLTVSQYSKKRLEKHFKVTNVDITPNAVESVFFDSYDKKAIKKELKKKYGLENYFIYISRIEPRKNHHTLLKTYIDYGYYKKFQLVFVGNVSIENHELMRLYESLEESIKNKIFFLKQPDYNTFLSLVRGADLSIYPSFAEGFGIPPLETIAAKIPTVCANNTALADFSFLEKFTFNPYTQEDMHLVIQNALTDYPIDAFQSHVNQHYNWNKAATILSDLIKANV